MIVVAAMAALVTAAPAQADPIVVDRLGGGDFAIIQNGIDAASEGDTVLVMPGTYNGPGNRLLDFNGVDSVLTVSGGSGSVTIDCESVSAAFYFHSGETAACVVDGFTVVNGLGTNGGGLYASFGSPTVRNCAFDGNSATVRGGAVYCVSDGSPTFESCTFATNYSQYGGAAYVDEGAHPTFNGCVFDENSAEYNGGALSINHASVTVLATTFQSNESVADFNDGGAVYFSRSSGTVSGCDFAENEARGYGGGVSVRTFSSPEFIDTLFSGNSVFDVGGGAVYVYDNSSPGFVECAFRQNQAPMGGAVYCEHHSDPTFTDCLFAHHTGAERGGSMHYSNNCSPTMDGCTFYGCGANEGSTIWSDSSVLVMNSIIAGSKAGEPIHCDGASPTVECTDIHGNAGGDWVGCLAGMDVINDNLHADPFFCDASTGDLALDAASPCAAANAPACGRVGALGVGCDSPVEPASWGAVKALYR